MLFTGLSLLTLDLDDTLFPCGPVVVRANAALTAALAREGAPGLDGAAIQGRMKVVRAEAQTQMTYTALRERAIDSLLLEATGRAPDPDTVSACFDAWLDERQAAADALLFPGVVEALQRIRARHPSALVGAVTNGRGEPRAMPSLAPLFDFELSGAAPLAVT
jgi:phosphoglycolate phosphatase-like HAD superfamily hydrolase